MLPIYFFATKGNLGLKSLVGKSAGAVGKAVTKSTGAVGKVVTKSTGAVVKGATKGTKLIGKTLTSISDSPEKRALGDNQPAMLGVEAAQVPGMSGQALGFDEGLLLLLRSPRPSLSRILAT